MAELTGRALIAARCAKFFKDGDFVNLGIGLPLMCVNYLPEGVELWLEAEIGIEIFLRSNRGISLTPEGEEFLGYARQVTEQFGLLQSRYIEKKKKIGMN